MAYNFSDSWADEIAEVTTQPEYQTCEVRIVDPSLITRDYDVETGVTTITGNGVIYEGRARVIGVTRGSYDGNEGQSNPTTLVAVRVQLEDRAKGLRVKTGCTLSITSAPHNPVLQAYSFKAQSDFQGSSAASRTLNFNVDMDSSRG